MAARQGWTHEQTVDALIRKSGYLGPPTPSLRSALLVTRYQVGELWPVVSPVARLTRDADAKLRVSHCSTSVLQSLARPLHVRSPQTCPCACNAAYYDGR